MVLRALEIYRALKWALNDAMHGKGLVFTAAVVHDRQAQNEGGNVRVGQHRLLITYL